MYVAWCIKLCRDKVVPSLKLQVCLTYVALHRVLSKNECVKSSGFRVKRTESSIWHDRDLNLELKLCSYRALISLLVSPPTEFFLQVKNRK